MTVKTLEGAKKRLKQIEAASFVFTHALGVMEVDGWFGRGEPKKGLSECKVLLGGIAPGETFEDNICLDGGAVCAGIAIDVASQRYAKARRWNKDRTFRFAWNNLELFQTLNGRTPSQGLFAGIASWNDHDVTDYEDMKAGFATALQALTHEKAEVLRTFKSAGTWQLNTVT